MFFQSQGDCPLRWIMILFSLVPLVCLSQLVSADSFRNVFVDGVKISSEYIGKDGPTVNEYRGLKIVENNHRGKIITFNGIRISPKSSSSDTDKWEDDEVVSDDPVKEEEEETVDWSSEDEGSCRRTEDGAVGDNVVCDEEEGEEEKEVRIMYRNYGTIHYNIHNNMGIVTIGKYINYGNIHVHLHNNMGSVRVRIYNGDKTGRVFIHCHSNMGSVEIVKGFKGRTELQSNHNNFGWITERNLKPEEKRGFEGKYLKREFFGSKTIQDHNNMGHRDF